MIHDSIVIDLVKEDENMIKWIIDEFSNTPFGRFKVNASIGKNYGEMERC
jgi:hypothetical protein